MPVRVHIVGSGANEAVACDDGANTKLVKEDLLNGYGRGILKQQGIGVLTSTLAPGEYEYHLAPQLGPPTNFGNVVVFFGRQSEKLKVITLFNDLLRRVQSVPRWMKTLRYSDFSLCGDFGKDDLRDVASDAMLAAVPVTTSTDDKKIVVKLKSKGFSKFKHSQEEALSSIGSLFNRLDYIPRDKTPFPTVTWSLHLSEADFDAVLVRVTEDIMHRNEVIDRELASEYTMRAAFPPSPSPRASLPVCSTTS